MDLIVNSDGASRGNPGDSSYGFVIKDHRGVILHQEGGVIGQSTNNIAEYTAVLKSLEYIKSRYFKKAPHKIIILADSKLAVEQLSGRYKIKNKFLQILFDQIKSLEFDLGSVYYQHCQRADNFIADRLANSALDKQKL